MLCQFVQPNKRTRIRFTISFLKAAIIFEVRGHNVPTILTDGIPLGNVRFLSVSKPAQKPVTEPKYDKQELALSECFKPWNQVG